MTILNVRDERNNIISDLHDHCTVITVVTFLCFCLTLDDVCINDSGLQVSALFSWSDEARDVDIL